MPRKLLFILLIYFSISFSIAYGKESFNHRVIFLGNSITVGKYSSDGRGFRDELYYRLKAINFPFEFVGSAGINPFKGHFKSGAVIGDFYKGPGGNASFNVEHDMSKYNPTIAVIHLGTNDFWLGGEVTPYSYDGGLTFNRSVSGRLGHLIEFLLNWHNGTQGSELETIFVCKIIPKRNRHIQKTVEFNDAVEELVEAANRGELATIPPGILKLVDQYTTFDIKTMLSSDGTHPNGKGYSHMADVFYDAFMTLPLYMCPVSEQVLTEYSGRFIVDTLAVRVTDGFGMGVGNILVTFRVKQGDAEFAGSRIAYTDTSGIAVMDSVVMGDTDSSLIVAYSPGLIDSTAEFTLKKRFYREIAGRVLYFSSDKPVDNVVFKCEGSIEDEVVTDSDGKYFVTVDPETSKVELMPGKSSTKTEIFAYDAALAARCAMRLDTLSNMASLAADVDGDSSVTINDALAILNYVVGIDTTDTNIGDWVFNPKVIYFDSLMNDTTAETIYAAVKGDVHGGWSKGDSSGLYTVSLGYPDEVSPALAEYTLPVYVNGEGVVSSKLTIDFNPSFVEICNISPAIDALNFQSNISKNRGKAVIGFFINAPQKRANGRVVAKIKIKAEEFNSSYLKIEDAVVNGVHAEINQNYTDVENNNQFSSDFSFQPVYPNPFNNSCKVKFTLTRQRFVSITVFDILGRYITDIFNGRLDSGIHEVLWNAKDNSGLYVSSGTYLIKFKTEKDVAVRKIQLIR